MYNMLLHTHMWSHSNHMLSEQLSAVSTGDISECMQLDRLFATDIEIYERDIYNKMSEVKCELEKS